MNGIITTAPNRLCWQYDDEIMWIDACGKNGLRVRVTKKLEMPDRDWAIDPQPEEHAEIELGDEVCSIKNGNITAKINKFGNVWFENQKGETILKEQWLTKAGSQEPQSDAVFWKGAKTHPWRRV